MGLRGRGYTWRPSVANVAQHGTVALHQRGTRATEDAQHAANWVRASPPPIRPGGQGGRAISLSVPNTDPKIQNPQNPK
jgi:hypothetical protein